MEIVSFIMAIAVGILLGLVGGGGSVLAIPILVYLLNIEPIWATAYSLFIVGSAALLGVINNLQKGRVNIRVAFIFVVPSLLAVYFMRYYLIPVIPNELFSIGNLFFTKNNAIMTLFAIVMLTIAILMIRSNGSKKKEGEHKTQGFNYPMMAVEGTAVGILAGAIGAGGGFLIVPALVLRAQLPMKSAVGTSLLIISVNSLVGFVGDLQSGRPIDWNLLLPFTAFVMGGIFIGGYLSNYISNQKLKNGFGWFMLIIALYIITKELARLQIFWYSNH